MSGQVRPVEGRGWLPWPCSPWAWVGRRHGRSRRQCTSPTMFNHHAVHTTGGHQEERRRRNAGARSSNGPAHHHHSSTAGWVGVGCRKCRNHLLSRANSRFGPYSACLFRRRRAGRRRAQKCSFWNARGNEHLEGACAARRPRARPENGLPWPAVVATPSGVAARPVDFGQPSSPPAENGRPGLGHLAAARKLGRRAGEHHWSSPTTTGRHR